MNKSELEGVFYLTSEKEQIESERNNISLIASSGTGAQKTAGGEKLSIQEKYYQELERYDLKLAKLDQKIAAKKIEILDFTETIEDSQLRIIIRARCIQLKEWEDVAAIVGGGNSGENCRQKYHRFCSRLQ